MEHELWRQCVRWLIDTGVLPSAHKTTLRESQVFDLAQTLRDGVVLCHLLNVIKSGAIDITRIDIRPQMLHFSCVENLRTVIHSLQNVFGFPQQDLFSPHELYNMTNIPQVLRVLSKLSHLSIASSKFRPFPSLLCPRVSNQAEEEEIYRHLPDLASERELVDEDNLYDTVPDEIIKEESAYGSIIARKPSVSLPKDKRSYCATEIEETERNYVVHLNVIQDKFITPMRTFMQENDLRAIFANLEQLMPVHRDFLKSIEHAVKHNMVKMSEPFLKFKDPLLKYGVYCSNLYDALAFLADLMEKNDSLRECIEHLQDTAGPKKFTLRDLLCVSMQRVLKYHLLVKELFKNTPDSHPDKNDIGKALDAMQELSHYVNEVKRDSEMIATINKVESRLVGYSQQTPLWMYGRLMKDGDLKIKNTRDNKFKPRFVYLFNQALFVTSAKSDTYKLKDLVRLEEFSLDEMRQVKGAKWTWSWSLKEKHGFQSYTVHAKTEGDKTKWLESIKAAFEALDPSELKGKEHNFKLTTFNEPTYCSVCRKLLLGTFFQGYFCRRTNKKCHKLCLAESYKIAENADTDSHPVVDKVQASPSHPPRPSSTTLGTQYRAHRDYNGNPRPKYNDHNFIVFNTGELIQVEDQISKDWYAGVLDRDQAETLLAGRPSGTFLVRSREEHLAISLIYQNEMKHIKILRSQNMYFVAESKNFKSVQELVKYYQEHMMNTSFLGLDTTLKYPYRDPEIFPGIAKLKFLPQFQKSMPAKAHQPKASNPNIPGSGFKALVHMNSPPVPSSCQHHFERLGQGRVLYDFEPRSPQELGLKANQIVNIISKAGGSHGWWKGECEGKVGYFPCKFIQELQR